MAQNENLSLSWDTHQKNICNGLSLLQQRGEFVDMTLAADGHHVKVHQMVLSLVSPYIKDLISTAQCPHPVIFLNNISYTTLSAILEYIYTGEVVVPKNRLSDLIAAGKALHIRGLREMDVEKPTESMTAADTSFPTTLSVSENLKEKMKFVKKEKKATPVPTCKIYLDETKSKQEDSYTDMEDTMMDTHDDSTIVEESFLDTTALNNSNNGQSDKKQDLTPDDTRKTLFRKQLQYTVSNQGGLQVIYNRFIYQLRYVKKDGTRNWRCITYNDTRCAASISTNKFHEVSERSFIHNHPFHDKNILKKLRNGLIYTKFQQAEKISVLKQKKKTKSDPE